MPTMRTEYPERVHYVSDEDRTQGLRAQVRSLGKGQGWMIGGLVLLGLGLLAAYKFGPDVMRYIKMERM